MNRRECCDTYRIVVAELKLETEDVALVDGVCVHDLDVHEPCLEVFC